MRILLDEMHAASIARALRERGIDAVAVTESSGLRGSSDVALLEHAAAEARAVVTENVRDFAPLAAQWAAEQRTHGGIGFTNPRRFDRRSLAYPGVLIDALDALASDERPSSPGAVIWL